jgi:hypothetical protein
LVSSKYQFVRNMCIQRLHKEDYLLFSANEKAELELAEMADNEEEFLTLLTKKYPIRMLSIRLQLSEETIFQRIQRIENVIHEETLKQLDNIQFQEISPENNHSSSERAKSFLVQLTSPEKR